MEFLDYTVLKQNGRFGFQPLNPRPKVDRTRDSGQQVLFLRCRPEGHASVPPTPSAPTRRWHTCLLVDQARGVGKVPGWMVFASRTTGLSGAHG